MFAIRARRKVATERDFLDAVEKVVRQGTKFSSTWVLLFTVRWCLTPGIGHCIRCITEVEYIVVAFGCKISYTPVPSHNLSILRCDHVLSIIQIFIPS